MSTPSAAYLSRAAGKIQDTVYTLSLPDFGVFYSTDNIVGLSTEKIINQRPSLAVSQTNYMSGAATKGNISLRLQDRNGIVTELRRQGPVKGKRHEIYQGYRGLHFDHHLRVMKGRLLKFDRSDDGLIYTVEAQDKIAETDIERFTPASLAAEPWTGEDKAWEGGLTLSSSTGEEPYDTVTLLGNPLELLLHILLSDGSMTGDYNTYPSWACIGLTADDVDVDWIEAERDKILTVSMRFTIQDAVNIKSWMETEIAKALGGYVLLSNTGKIRIHYPSVPVSTSALETVTDATSTGKPPWSEGNDLYISHIKFKLDHDGSDFQTVLPTKCSQEFLNGIYDEEREHTIESKGLQSDLGGISIALSVADNLFRRYGNPPPRMRFRTFYSKHLISAGDSINVTSSYIKNTDGRGVGVERVCEVLSAKPVINHVELDVIDLAGPSTAGRVAVIAPPTVAATYSTATDADKAYAYIADQDSEEFENGDPPYVLG